MSMNFFRSKRNSTISIVIFGVIILSFVFFGTGQIQNVPQNALTTVNGESIPYRDFERQVNQQIETYGKIFGGGQKVNKNLRDFIERRVVQQLITRKLMAQEARKVGIIVGKEDIVAELKKIEEFNDPEKKRFSPRVYELVLQANGLNPKSFEESIQEQLSAQRFAQLIDHSLIASQLSQQDSKRIENYQFDLQVAVFTPEDLKKKGKIKLDEKSIQTFYDERKSEFKTPEKRKLEIARLSLEDLENATSPSDEQLETYYNQNIKSSADTQWKKKRARALHILISDKTTKGEASINRIKKDLEAETKKLSQADLESFFRQLAQSKSEDYASAAKGGDLGYFDEQAMVKAFAESVFSSKTKLNTVVGPIKSDFGYHLIFVLDRTNDQNSFSNRKNEITYLLKKEAADKKLTEVKALAVDQVQGSNADHKDFLAKQGFEVQTTAAIDRNQREELIPFTIIQKAYESELNKWQAPEAFDESLYLYRVVEVVAPEQMSLEQARPSILTQILSTSAEKTLDSYYQDLKSQKMTWSALTSSTTEMKTEKAVKAFLADQVPGFSQSDSLLRSMQSLTKNSPYSRPILHQGKWYMMYGSQFSDTTATQSAEDFASTLTSPTLEPLKGSLVETYVQSLMKEASIPKAFREKYQL